MQLGMTLMGAGRYEEAAAPLKRAADLAPTMFLPTIHLGLLYNHLGRSEEAIAPLEVAVTASGRHPWTLSALAVCYSALGKLSEVDAISDELLARARREDGQSATPAIVAASLRRMDVAVEVLDPACGADDGVPVFSQRHTLFNLLQ